MPNEDTTPKKGANRLAKEVIVEEIKANLDNATSIVLTDYQGLTHKQLEEFKKQLKTANAKFAITKNTLLKISLSASKNFADKIPAENLEAPTATLFISGDPINALKALAKLAKDTGLPKIKVGVVDGSVLGQEQIVKLSTLPNKETLIAQFVGTLNSPIQGLVVVLNGNIQKLALVLNAIAQKKPAEAAPAPAAEPATTEAAAQTTEAPAAEAQTEAPAQEVEAAPAPADQATAGIGDEPTVDAVEDAQVEAKAEEASSETPAQEETTNNDEKSEGGENS